MTRVAPGVFFKREDAQRRDKKRSLGVNMPSEEGERERERDGRASLSSCCSVSLSLSKTTSAPRCPLAVISDDLVPAERHDSEKRNKGARRKEGTTAKDKKVWERSHVYGD